MNSFLISNIYIFFIWNVFIYIEKDYHINIMLAINHKTNPQS